MVASGFRLVCLFRILSFFPSVVCFRFEGLADVTLRLLLWRFLPMGVSDLLWTFQIMTLRIQNAIFVSSDLAPRKNPPDTKSNEVDQNGE